MRLRIVILLALLALPLLAACDRVRASGNDERQGYVTLGTTLRF